MAMRRGESLAVSHGHRMARLSDSDTEPVRTYGFTLFPAYAPIIYYVLLYVVAFCRCSVSVSKFISLRPASVDRPCGSGPKVLSPPSSTLRQRIDWMRLVEGRGSSRQVGRPACT
ncbi:hypothetical protein BDW75DRAFT_103373 [Aspergillus navahoensis]